MSITKPAVLPAWGDTAANPADIVQPSTPQISAGWPLSPVPPSRQYFNWVLNYSTNGIRYFSRRGLVDYDAAETYLLNDIVRGNDNVLYQSLANANTGNTPSTSPTKWGPVSLFRQLTCEANAGITPASTGIKELDARRYGIIPNDSSAPTMTANSAALKALLDPTQPNGPTGTIIFPAIVGQDTYYFNDLFQVRPGITLDLCGTTIGCIKTYAAADDTMGLFTFVRDVKIKNGYLAMNYAGSGTQAGTVMRIGSRNGYKFANYSNGIFDLDDGVNQGNIVLEGLKISTNNANASAAILMLGGLTNVAIDNIEINGNNAAAFGIYYEFGWATKNGSGTQSLWSSSHAHNMHFRNIKALNLATGGPDGAGLALVGAYNCMVENLYVNVAKNGFQYRLGEALFYRAWPNVDDNGGKRCITLRNICAQGIISNGIQLTGAESATDGYLSGAGLTASQQVDLMSFSLDGFAISSAGSGVFVSGPATISNGHIKGALGSGGITWTDDCVQLDINTVRIEGATAAGIRGNFAGIGVWATPRGKIGQIRNCMIAGGAAEAIVLDNTMAIRIDNNRLGYNSSYDSVGNEATQGIGVSLLSAAKGVNCVENFITVASGNAYNSAGSGDRGNNIERPKGTTTFTAGAFLLDGVAQAIHTAFLDKNNVINTASKYYGKRCWDSTNHALYYARGSANTDLWDLVDGSASLTPV